MFVDAKKAHDEFEEHGMYATLRRWVYGMMKAASGLEDDYSQKLTMDGFRRGRTVPTIFFHSETQVRVVLRGDDFTFAIREPDRS